LLEGKAPTVKSLVREEVKATQQPPPATTPSSSKEITTPPARPGRALLEGVAPTVKELREVVPTGVQKQPAQGQGAPTPTGGVSQGQAQEEFGGFEGVYRGGRLYRLPSGGVVGHGNITPPTPTPPTGGTPQGQGQGVTPPTAHPTPPSTGTGGGTGGEKSGSDLVKDWVLNQVNDYLSKCTGKGAMTPGEITGCAQSAYNIYQAMMDLKSVNPKLYNELMQDPTIKKAWSSILSTVEMSWGFEYYANPTVDLLSRVTGVKFVGVGSPHNAVVAGTNNSTQLANALKIYTDLGGKLTTPTGASLLNNLLNTATSEVNVAIEKGDYKELYEASSNLLYGLTQLKNYLTETGAPQSQIEAVEHQISQVQNINKYAGIMVNIQNIISQIQTASSQGNWGAVNNYASQLIQYSQELKQVLTAMGVPQDQVNQIVSNINQYADTVKWLAIINSDIATIQSAKPPSVQPPAGKLMATTPWARYSPEIQFEYQLQLGTQQYTSLADYLSTQKQNLEKLINDLNTLKTKYPDIYNTLNKDGALDKLLNNANTQLKQINNALPTIQLLAQNYPVILQVQTLIQEYNNQVQSFNTEVSPLVQKANALNGAVALLNLAQSGGDPRLTIQGMLSQAGISIDPNKLQAVAKALATGQSDPAVSNILNQLMNIKTTYTINGVTLTVPQWIAAYYYYQLAKSNPQAFEELMNQTNQQIMNVMGKYYNSIDNIVSQLVKLQFQNPNIEKVLPGFNNIVNSMVQATQQAFQPYLVYQVGQSLASNKELLKQLSKLNESLQGVSVSHVSVEQQVDQALAGLQTYITNALKGVIGKPAASGVAEALTTALAGGAAFGGWFISPVTMLSSTLLNILADATGGNPVIKKVAKVMDSVNNYVNQVTAGAAAYGPSLNKMIKSIPFIGKDLETILALGQKYMGPGTTKITPASLVTDSMIVLFFIATLGDAIAQASTNLSLRLAGLSGKELTSVINLTEDAARGDIDLGELITRIRAACPNCNTETISRVVNLIKFRQALYPLVKAFTIADPLSDLMMGLAYITSPRLVGITSDVVESTVRRVLTTLGADPTTAEAVGKALARFVTLPAYLFQSYENAVGRLAARLEETHPGVAMLLRGMALIPAIPVKVIEKLGAGVLDIVNPEVSAKLLGEVAPGVGEYAVRIEGKTSMRVPTGFTGFIDPNTVYKSASALVSIEVHKPIGVVMGQYNIAYDVATKVGKMLGLPDSALGRLIKAIESGSSDNVLMTIIRDPTLSKAVGFKVPDVVETVLAQLNNIKNLANQLGIESYKLFDDVVWDYVVTGARPNPDDIRYALGLLGARDVPDTVVNKLVNVIENLQTSVKPLLEAGYNLDALNRALSRSLGGDVNTLITELSAVDRRAFRSLVLAGNPRLAEVMDFIDKQISGAGKLIIAIPTETITISRLPPVNLGYTVWQANYVVAGSLPVEKLPSAVAKVVEPFVSDSKAATKSLLESLSSAAAEYYARSITDRLASAIEASLKSGDLPSELTKELLDAANNLWGAITHKLGVELPDEAHAEWRYILTYNLGDLPTKVREAVMDAIETAMDRLMNNYVKPTLQKFLVDLLQNPGSIDPKAFKKEWETFIHNLPNVARDYLYASIEKSLGDVISDVLGKPIAILKGYVRDQNALDRALADFNALRNDVFNRLDSMVKELVNRLLANTPSVVEGLPSATDIVRAMQRFVGIEMYHTLLREGAIPVDDITNAILEALKNQGIDPRAIPDSLLTRLRAFIVNEVVGNNNLLPKDLAKAWEEFLKSLGANADRLEGIDIQRLVDDTFSHYLGGAKISTRSFRDAVKSFSKLWSSAIEKLRNAYRSIYSSITILPAVYVESPKAKMSLALADMFIDSLQKSVPAHLRLPDQIVRNMVSLVAGGEDTKDAVSLLSKAYRIYANEQLGTSLLDFLRERYASTKISVLKWMLARLVDASAKSGDLQFVMKNADAIASKFGKDLATLLTSRYIDYLSTDALNEVLASGGLDRWGSEIEKVTKEFFNALLKEREELVRLVSSGNVEGLKALVRRAWETAVSSTGDEALAKVLGSVNDAFVDVLAGYAKRLGKVLVSEDLTNELNRLVNAPSGKAILGAVNEVARKYLEDLRANKIISNVDISNILLDYLNRLGNYRRGLAQPVIDEARALMDTVDKLFGAASPTVEKQINEVLGMLETERKFAGAFDEYIDAVKQLTNAKNKLSELLGTTVNTYQDAVRALGPDFARAVEVEDSIRTIQSVVNELARLGISEDELLEAIRNPEAWKSLLGARYEELVRADGELSKLLSNVLGEDVHSVSVALPKLRQAVELVDKAVSIVNEAGRVGFLTPQDITALTDYLTKLKDLVRGSVEVVTATGGRAPLTIDELLDSLGAIRSLAKKLASMRSIDVVSIYKELDRLGIDIGKNKSVVDFIAGVLTTMRQEGLDFDAFAKLAREYGVSLSEHDLRDLYTAITNAMKREVAITEVLNFMRDLKDNAKVGALMAWLSNANPEVGAVLTDIEREYTAFTTGLNDLANAIKGLANNAEDLARSMEQLRNIMDTNLPVRFQAVKEYAESRFPSIAEALDSNSLGTVLGGLEELAEEIRNQYPRLGEILGALDALRESEERITKLQPVIEGAMNELRRFVPTAEDPVSTWTKFVEAVNERVKNLIGEVPPSIDESIAYLRGLSDLLRSGVVNYLRWRFGINSVEDLLKPGVIDNVLSDPVLNKLGEYAPDLWSSINDVANRLKRHDLLLGLLNDVPEADRERVWREVVEDWNKRLKSLYNLQGNALNTDAAVSLFRKINADLENAIADGAEPAMALKRDARLSNKVDQLLNEWLHKNYLDKPEFNLAVKAIQTYDALTPAGKLEPEYRVFKYRDVVVQYVDGLHGSTITILGKDGTQIQIFKVPPTKVLPGMVIIKRIVGGREVWSAGFIDLGDFLDRLLDLAQHNDLFGGVLAASDVVPFLKALGEQARKWGFLKLMDNADVGYLLYKLATMYNLDPRAVYSVAIAWDWGKTPLGKLAELASASEDTIAKLVQDPLFRDLARALSTTPAEEFLPPPITGERARALINDFVTKVRDYLGAKALASLTGGAGLPYDVKQLIESGLNSLAQLDKLRLLKYSSQYGTYVPFFQELVDAVKRVDPEVGAELLNYIMTNTEAGKLYRLYEAYRRDYGLIRAMSSSIHYDLRALMQDALMRSGLLSVLKGALPGDVAENIFNMLLSGRELDAEKAITDLVRQGVISEDKARELIASIRQAWQSLSPLIDADRAVSDLVATADSAFNSIISGDLGRLEGAPTQLRNTLDRILRDLDRARDAGLISDDVYNELKSLLGKLSMRISAPLALLEGVDVDMVVKAVRDIDYIPPTIRGEVVDKAIESAGSPGQVLKLVEDTAEELGVPTEEVTPEERVAEIKQKMAIDRLVTPGKPIANIYLIGPMRITTRLLEAIWNPTGQPEESRKELEALEHAVTASLESLRQSMENFSKLDDLITAIYNTMNTRLDLKARLENFAKAIDLLTQDEYYSQYRETLIKLADKVIGAARRGEAALARALQDALDELGKIEGIGFGVLPFMALASSLITTTVKIRVQPPQPPKAQVQPAPPTTKAGGEKEVSTATGGGAQAVLVQPTEEERKVEEAINMIETTNPTVASILRRLFSEAGVGKYSGAVGGAAGLIQPPSGTAYGSVEEGGGGGGAEEEYTFDFLKGLGLPDEYAWILARRINSEPLRGIIKKYFFNVTNFINYLKAVSTVAPAVPNWMDIIRALLALQYQYQNIPISIPPIAIPPIELTLPYTTPITIQGIPPITLQQMPISMPPFGAPYPLPPPIPPKPGPGAPTTPGTQRRRETKTSTEYEVLQL
jgi:mevalonate kinase